MPSTALPPAVRSDKALVRQIDDFDSDVEAAEDFADLMKGGSAKAPLHKEAAVLRKRMSAALEGKDLKEVAKAVAALGKDAKKLQAKAGEAFTRDHYDRYMARWTKARGLLAQALLEVAGIEPLALRRPLQSEQAALRASLDEIEKTNVADIGNIDQLDKLLPEIEAFVKRLDPVRKAGDWMRGSYLPLLTRVEATLKRVPAERCRKSLLAELDFIEVDTSKALGKGDVRAVQARSVPALQRIERLAVRVVAASPAVDRELARLAKAVAGQNAGPLAQRLKALIKAKGTTWPAGADVEAIEGALTAFEAELGRLAAEIDKAGAAAAPAKA